MQGETMYLDPMNRYIPTGLLHPQSLNGGGLVVKGRQASMVAIHPDLGSTRQVNAIISVDENGNANTQLQMRYNGYGAIVPRIIFENEEEEQDEIQEYFMNQIFRGLTNVDIDSYRVINLDNTDSPFEIRLMANVPDYSQKLDDMIFVNPFVGNFRQRNPFVRETRAIPVELNYGIQQNYTATISAPEGYVVHELPQNSTVRFGDNNAYVVQYANNGSNAQISVRFVRNEIWIDASQYAALKKFYTDIENLTNNQIVFRKVQDAVEPDDAE